MGISASTIMKSIVTINLIGSAIVAFVKARVQHPFMMMFCRVSEPTALETDFGVVFGI